MFSLSLSLSLEFLLLFEFVGGKRVGEKGGAVIGAQVEGVDGDRRNISTGRYTFYSYPFPLN